MNTFRINIRRTFLSSNEPLHKSTSTLNLWILLLESCNCSERICLVYKGNHSAANKVWPHYKKESEATKLNLPLIWITQRLVKSHSLIFISAFPLGRVADASALEGLQLPHDQRQSQIVCSSTGSSQVGGEITLPGPWSTPGPISRECSQYDLPRRSFLGHSGHMPET